MPNFEIARLPGIDKPHYYPYNKHVLEAATQLIFVLGMPCAGKDTVIRNWLARNNDRVQFIDQQTKTFEEYQLMENAVDVYQHLVQLEFYRVLQETVPSTLPIVVKRNGWDRQIFMRTFETKDDHLLEIERVIESTIYYHTFAIILCLVSPEVSLLRRLSAQRKGKPGPTFNVLPRLFLEYLQLHQYFSSLHDLLPSEVVMYVPLNMMAKQEKAQEKFDTAMAAILKRLAQARN